MSDSVYSAHVRHVVTPLGAAPIISLALARQPLPNRIKFNCFPLSGTILTSKHSKNTHDT